MNAIAILLILCIGVSIFCAVERFQQRARDKARQQAIESGHIVCNLHWSE